MLEIELMPETEAVIRARLDSGLYLDASDVIRDALRHMDDRDQRLERLRAEIALGLEDAEQGRTIPRTDSSMEEIIAEVDEEQRLDIPADIADIQP